MSLNTPHHEPDLGRKASEQKYPYTGKINKFFNEQNPNYFIPSGAHEFFKVLPSGQVKMFKEEDLVNQSSKLMVSTGIEGMIDSIKKDFNAPIHQIAFQKDSDCALGEGSNFSIYIALTRSSKNGEFIVTTKRVTVLFPKGLPFEQEEEIYNKIYNIVPTGNNTNGRSFKKLFRDTVPVFGQKINMINKEGVQTKEEKAPSIMDTIITKIKEPFKAYIDHKKDDVVQVETISHNEVHKPETPEQMRAEEVLKVEPIVEKAYEVNEMKAKTVAQHAAKNIAESQTEKHIESLDNVLGTYENMISVAEEGRKQSKVSLVVTSFGKKFSEYMRNVSLLSLNRKTRSEKDLLKEKSFEFVTMIKNLFGIKALQKEKNVFSDQWDRIAEYIKKLGSKSDTMKNTLLKVLGFGENKVAVEKQSLHSNSILNNVIDTVKSSSHVIVNGEVKILDAKRYEEEQKAKKIKAEELKRQSKNESTSYSIENGRFVILDRAKYAQEIAEKKLSEEKRQQQINITNEKVKVQENSAYTVKKPEIKKPIYIPMDIPTPQGFFGKLWGGVKEKALGLFGKK